MADQVQWQLSGDYFENCNCSVVCPCLVSKAALLPHSQPRVSATCHLSSTSRAASMTSIALDGLNIALAIQTPGPMAEGETGRWRPISTNALTTSRPKP